MTGRDRFNPNAPKHGLETAWGDRTARRGRGQRYFVAAPNRVAGRKRDGICGEISARQFVIEGNLWPHGPQRDEEFVIRELD